MQVRNPKYTATSSIDCEIDHPQFGWIPFTASPDDTEQLGRDVYQHIVSGASGDIAPYVPIQRTPEQLSAESEQQRHQAYTLEADPLFFKAQRGEATMDEWIAKVAEIKSRYPG